MIRLVRLALADKDSTVRTAAVDALVDLSVTEDVAVGAVILVLGLYADDRDRAVAVAARAAVADMAKAELPEPKASTEPARQEAFLTWWRGDVASDAKIRALAGYAHVQDIYPEDVLMPYLKDPDVFVADAAWREMSGIAKQLIAKDAAVRAAARPEQRQQVGVLTPQRRAWFQRLPAHRDGALRGSNAAATQASLAAWAAQMPK